MKLSSFPTTAAGLAVWLALVSSTSGSVVGGAQQPRPSSASSQRCVDQGGQATGGICNRTLLISLTVVPSSFFVIALSILVWLKFRRRKSDAKMMEELGINVKRPPSRGPRDTVNIVIIKLPGLRVSIPSGKVSGEVPQSPDSIVTPTPFHVGQ